MNKLESLLLLSMHNCMKQKRKLPFDLPHPADNADEKTKSHKIKCTKSEFY